ncbi:uncharacterized protein PSANT_06458 [Moesziomyces antarcticus]|uniref:Uncharacterized protein n=1 Tax=Pseudozyma antarctica TaxID=84753 RepID=A0A5C3FZ07_PSEA2|nr:uncharacterized protein PSANT_06458 [Moesziomyces antarcticus]
MATLVNSSDIAPCSPEAPFGCSLAYVNLSSSICPGSLVNASSPCYSCRMQTAQEQKEFLGNLTQVLGSNSAATCATSGGATSAASRRVTMPSSWFLLVALLLFCFGAASAKEVALVPDKVLKKSSYQDVDGRILLTNPSDCGPVNQPQERVCSFDVYSDPNCQNAISGAYFSMNPNIGHNCGACLPWSMLDPVPAGTVYLKTHSIGDGFGAGNQLLVEADSSCPLMGSAGLVAAASASSQCLQLGSMSGDEGIACFPNGQDSVPAKRDLVKRDATCNGMYVESAVASHSAPKQISSIVDCRGGSAPCTISLAVQHTETVSTSLSLNAGGSVKGIDIGATFGTEYSESVSTTITETYTVPQGQAGYVISTFKSTLFKGSFQGCGGVDGAGEANVILTNGEEKRVVIVTA